MQQTDLEMGVPTTDPREGIQEEVDGLESKEATSSDASLQTDSNRQSTTIGIDHELLKALRDGDANQIKKFADDKSNNLFSGLTPQGNTVLHIASRFRTKTLVIAEILRVLQPPPLDKKNEKGENPMHIAAKTGVDGTVKLFLDNIIGENGARNILGMQDNEGNTPLHNAVINNHRSVVLMLVGRHDAPPHSVNEAGKSPLSIAIDLSLADIAADIINTTPESLRHIEAHEILPILHSAISRGDPELVDRILNLKKEVVNMPDKERKNPLHFAAASGHVEVAERLLRENASLTDLGDHDGRTPIHVAAASGHVEIAKSLLGKNPSLMYLRDHDGRMPLHVAAASGHVDIAGLLLEANASLEYLRDHYGPAPRFAAAIDHGEIAPLLSKLGNVPLACQADFNGQTPLHYAAASGHVSIATSLLRENSSVAYQGEHGGQTPLHIAVKNGQLPILKTIFSYCPDAIDVLDNRHQNILHVAAQYGNGDIVSLIVEFPGIEDLLNSPDQDGNTPLHLASKSSHRDVVKILTRNTKVNINATDHEQKTPLEVVDKSTDSGRILHKQMTDLKKAASSKITPPDSERDSYRTLIKAIRRGDCYKIWDLAAEKPDDLFSGTSPEGNTALHIAARYGNFMVALQIIERKSSLLKEKNDKGETPLHIAAKYGHFFVVFALFKRDELRGDLDFDEERNTPLHNAVRHGHEITADYLIYCDKNLIREENKAGQTPLAIAIDARLSYIARIIIQKDPTSLDYEGPEGLTPLHSAVIKQDYDIMVEILKHKDKLIDKLDAKARNPLHYAAASGNVKMARRLSHGKASLVYQADINGQTPLHLAAKNGQPNVLKTLLKNYPDAIELRDKSGHNILHIAAQNGVAKTVSFILKLPQMVDLVNLRDEKGNTPLHLASREFHSDVVYILSKHGIVNIRETNNDKETALQIVETSTVEGKDIQKHLTRKALKAACKDRGLEAEDINDQDEQRRREPKDAEDIHKKNRASVGIEARYRESGRGKEMAQTLSVMNTLIATFTFTAAFTIPGGFRSSGGEAEGMAVLVKRTSFQAFVITDTIAMTSSMTAAVIVFWSFWRSKSEYFMDSLPMAIFLTWIGLVSMILAFVTGLYVVLSSNMVLAITVSSIGCTLPLIFYVFAPFISLLSNQSANVNPFAFTFRMMKIFLKKPIGWSFRCLRISWTSPGILMLYNVGGSYYLAKARLLQLSDRCFRRESKINDQPPTSA